MRSQRLQYLEGDKRENPEQCSAVQSRASNFTFNHAVAIIEADPGKADLREAMTKQESHDENFAREPARHVFPATANTAFPITF